MTIYDKSNREISRGKRKREGDRSSRISRQLMQLKEPLLKRLVIDIELRDVINKARAITSMVARRRAERALAGELRRYDLADLDAKLAKVYEATNIDTAAMHLAEKWRARLIEEGMAAAPELPNDKGSDPELVRLIDAARKERDVGRPPGAARALFRWVVKALEAPPEVDEDLVDDLADDDSDDSDDTDDTDDTDDKR